MTHSNEIKILHVDDFQETLQIAKVTPDHVGNYTCAAKNSFGSDQASVTVMPRYQPVWLNPNSTSVAVVLGETLMLDCAARGQPVPTISITKGILVHCGDVLIIFFLFDGQVRTPCCRISPTRTLGC